LREDDPETPNPAGVDVDKQRRGVGWRPGTTQQGLPRTKNKSSGFSMQNLLL